MVRAVFVLVLLVFVGHCWLSGRPLERGPGVLAPNEPVQRNLSNGKILEKNGYQLRELASFSLEARVLAAERYRYDRGADLAPMDLALGWGPMSSNAVLNGIDFDQYGRFYFWQTKEPLIEINDIEIHSANMHMIPATDAVRDVLLSARPGNLIELDGYLVEATAPDGFRWTTSLIRTDTGAGACELVLVEHIKLH
jgi:hypothetical protein